MINRRFIRLLFVPSVMLAASACQTVGDTNAAQSITNPATPVERDPQTLILSPLTNAALNVGECGMILWTLDASEPAPILRYVAGEGAEISISGQPYSLDVATSNGANRFGIAETQTFTDEAGTTVSTNIEFGLGFEGGIYLQRGVVNVELADGWRFVAPAAGVAGCRTR